MVDRVVLVSPRGFCAGVVRAISTVERALETLGSPVYVRGAIVHNAQVVSRLAAAGATFVDELEDVPRGATVVFSAHGVPASVREAARRRDLRVVDATCPLVLKVHQEVRRFASLGLDVLLIGQAGHDEVVGTLGQGPDVRLIEAIGDVSSVRVADPGRVACVTQTTLSPLDAGPINDELRTRFPSMVEPAVLDICFATRHRQAAIAWLADEVDIVLVVGDRASSNSRHLRAAAFASGTPAVLIGSVADLQEGWLAEADVVGISAGASTPEHLVAEVVEHFVRQGALVEEKLFMEERVAFGLPRGLAPRSAAMGSQARGQRAVRRNGPGHSALARP